MGDLFKEALNNSSLNQSEFPQAKTKNGAPILEGEIDAPFLWAGASRPERNEFVSSAKSSLLLTTNN